MSTSAVRRRLAAVGAPTLAVGLVLTLGASSGSSAPGAGAVTLTASGTVEAPQQLALSFEGTGRIVEVGVRAGDRVSRGMVLARLDPAPALAGLQTATANLTSARAQLLQLRQGLAPADRAQLGVALKQSRQALVAAERSLTDARAASAHEATRLQTAVGQSNAQLTSDRQKLATDQAALTSDHAAAGSADDRVSGDRAKFAADSAALLDAQDHQADDQAIPTAPTTLADDAKAILADQAAVASDQARLAEDISAAADAHNLIASDHTRVSADQNAVVADQSALVTADNARAAGTVAERQSVDIAQAAVESAHVGVSATRAANAVHAEPARVGTLAAARAAVRVAEAALATAEQSLRETRLVAPFSGTVAAVNALAGQLAGGGGAGSGGTPLITLVNLDELTITASFQSAQAALLTPGRSATATIPALADVQVSGRLAAIDPLPDPPPATAGSAGATSGAAATSATAPSSYTATFALADPPPTLLPGMEADVTVAATTPVRG